MATAAGVKEKEVLEDIVQESLQRDFSELQPRAVANIVWSCTVLGVKPPEMFTVCSNDLGPSLRSDLAIGENSRLWMEL